MLSVNAARFGRLHLFRGTFPGHGLRLSLVRRPCRPLMESSLDEGERRCAGRRKIPRIVLRLGEARLHHRHGLDEPDREQRIASGKPIAHAGYDEVKLLEGRSYVHWS